MNALLAWYFVAVWGSGYVATKIGLQYAAPFTFLSLRFAFGLACLLPIVMVWKPAWPKSGAELGQLVAAVVVSGWMGEKLAPRQWTGVFIGLAGVALVVWHKIDIREVTAGSLA